ncbi:DEAD/DEAH box helicase family protein [Spirosoma sp. KUDC1026]|uniref:restriction endonuclease n=1 Tax=Spirosoma sp. KUDC1026 TaxID=2745947 RepID=UPI00159B9204|nr:DEAD/DEAH box helicase family protein [Spirosoma sp. KUDC1026]QKZ12965.1 DEAD/DEAH box helicase family protein [Spirosoma sp. KUDC1026]
MKLKFDSSQAYQLDAIQSIVDLFDGQPLTNGDYSVQINTSTVGGYGSLFQSELGIGNNIVLDEEVLLKNLNAVQERNDLEPISGKQFRQNGLNFSVEMETGTGKTYVYLRTIFELSQKYGFKKFIIVVPSVPIREGTLKNIEITAEHFRSLYNNIEFEHFVYDSRKANRLRQFATSNQIQLMVINIDAFRKDFSDSESEKKSNVIFKENDKLSGRKPIEFVQATQPIVIIDEPQSVDGTPRAQEAIKSLNPSCILRYSATHRNPYNLVYQLDPVKAYALRLVKQIVVASVMGENAQNDAYIKLLEVDNKSGIRARLRIQVQATGQIKEKDVWVKQNADLFTLSNEREAYRNGFEVLDISAEPGNEFIDFTSGRLYIGQERGGIKEDLMQVQIRNTIKKHLDKELQLKGKGVKVLSLFFIDKVANYREYDADGSPQKGKFASLFEQYYRELIQLPMYRELDVYPVEQLHDGYFSQDKKGVYKDTTGSTQADDDTYAKIMRNKEQLLSLDEPLKFIFSHSALREGWDNPNVFQICTLNESRSAFKKRQEIGRGLRLPVNQNGERIFDNTVNKLTVIANESYDEFAKKLQNEYEDDCGVTFGKVPKTGFARIIRLVGEQEMPIGRTGSERIWAEIVGGGMLDANGKILPAFNPKREGFTLGLSDDFKDVENEVVTILQSYQLERHIKKDEEPKPLRINKRVYLDEDFKRLWERIKPKTTYQVDFDTEELVRNCVKAIRAMEKVEPATIVYKEAQLDVAVKGVSASETKVLYHKVQFSGALPDILAYLQKETELTRRTLVDILTKSERLQEFAINPQRFMDAVAAVIKHELHQLMIDGIKYERIADQEWSMRLFEDYEIKSYLDSRLEVNKSVYDAIVYDSNVERTFAEALDKREDVKLFVKLPDWFKIETPIGTYNPDWAIVKHEDDTLYLVRETKDTHNYEKLRNSEAAKIRCGREHFKALGVNYKQIVLASEI